MSALDAWRQKARALIPRGFLRRDHGSMLFASDYPRFPGAEEVTSSLRRAGFRVAWEGSIAHIDGTEEKYRSLFRGLACPDAAPTDDSLYAISLARRLIRAETAPEDEPIDVYPALLKMLDEGRLQDAADAAAARAALCQRQGRPLPTAAGKLLLLALTEREGEESSC